jgi:hypothetical protein
MNIVENDRVPSKPDRPSTKNNNLHKERFVEVIFDLGNVVQVSVYVKEI